MSDPILYTGVNLPAAMTDEEQSHLQELIEEDKIVFTGNAMNSIDPSCDLDLDRAFAYVNSLLATRAAEIERLKAQLERIRIAHDSASEVLQVLNADPTVAIFQIATRFQHMGNQVGAILNEASQESDT